MSEYNEAGYVRDLPALQDLRVEHGCSFYISDDGTKVDLFKLNIYYPMIIFQTYLVSGGLSGSPYFAMLFSSSTELLVETSSAWVYSGELPSPRSSLRGANIDNKILMIGNI